MRYKGRQYEADIKKLKELKASSLIDKKEKTRYKEFFALIEKKYCVSSKTIYRDMRKKIPGLRKRRADAGKIKSMLTKKEVKTAMEAFNSGVTKTAALKIVKSSYRKLKNTDAVLIQNDAKSMFGDKVKEHLKKIWELDLIGDDKIVQIKTNFSFNGKNEKISIPLLKEDLKDIVLIMSNAYNRSTNIKHKLTVDRDELRETLLWQLIEDQLRIVKETQDVKVIESLTRMIDRLKSKLSLSPNFEVVIKIAKELKPELSTSDVVTLVKKYSKPNAE